VEEQTATFAFPKLKAFKSENEVLIFICGQVHNKNTVSVVKDGFETNDDFLYTFCFISKNCDVTIVNVQFVFKLYQESRFVRLILEELENIEAQLLLVHVC
jgi:hypothetical protein